MQYLYMMDMLYRKVILNNLALIRSEVAGNFLNTQLLNIVENNKGIPVVPHYKFIKNKIEDNYISEYLSNVRDDPSYENYWKREIIKDLKETSLTISEELDGKRDLTPLLYELPDGKTVDITEEKQGLLERLFAPIKEIPGFNGYHYMVMDSINKSDLDIRKELYSNVFVCGGNTLFQGFIERLQKQLMTFQQSVKIKCISHPSLSERRFSSWIGGSILSSLGTFHQLWLSKAEYEEHGAMIIERKCA